MIKIKGFSWSQSLRLDGTLDMVSMENDINTFCEGLYNAGAKNISLTFNVISTLNMATPTPLERNGQTFRTYVVLISALIMWEDNALVAV